MANYNTHITSYSITGLSGGRLLMLMAALLLTISAAHAQQPKDAPAVRIDSPHVTTPGHTPPFALRNNLLYDAALTPNLGFDYRLSQHWSLGATVGYRP